MDCSQKSFYLDQASYKIMKSSSTHILFAAAHQATWYLVFIPSTLPPLNDELFNTLCTSLNLTPMQR